MNEAACVCLGWRCANSAYMTGRSERLCARVARTARTGVLLPSPSFFLPSDAPAPPSGLANSSSSAMLEGRSLH